MKRIVDAFNAHDALRQSPLLPGMITDVKIDDLLCPVQVTSVKAVEVVSGVWELTVNYEPFTFPGGSIEPA